MYSYDSDEDQEWIPQNVQNQVFNEESENNIYSILQNVK